MSIQKVFKVGNSLGVTLPAKLVKKLSLVPGHRVNLVQEADSSLTLTFIDNLQLNLGLPSTKQVNKKDL